MTSEAKAHDHKLRSTTIFIFVFIGYILQRCFNEATFLSTLAIQRRSVWWMAIDMIKFGAKRINNSTTICNQSPPHVVKTPQRTGQSTIGWLTLVYRKWILQTTVSTSQLQIAEARTHAHIRWREITALGHVTCVITPPRLRGSGNLP